MLVVMIHESDDKYIFNMIGESNGNKLGNPRNTFLNLKQLREN